MKVVVADRLPQRWIDELRGVASELVFDASLSGDALTAACADAEVLVVRSTKVPREVLAAAPRLALVVRAGAGVNTIDVAGAAQRGVFVANCPGRNAVAVAELALGLLLALDRRIPDNVEAFRDGRWEKKAFAQAQGLAGRTLGVVGVGQIGAAVASRARAFGMRVIGWSRSLDAPRGAALGIEPVASLDTLLAQADVVSLHLALNDETRGILGRERLMALREGTTLLNTARAGLIDEAALLDAVEARQLRVGLDVMADEPSGGKARVSSPLADHPRVYVTHHIGASTAQAQDAVAEEVVRIVRTFIAQGRVPNCVNLCAASPATHQLAVRHLDRVGVLAAVLGELSAAHMNVEEMENQVFAQAAAACAFIRLGSEPTEDVLRRVGELEHVLGVMVQTL